MKESEVYNQIFGINWFSFLPESVLIFILCIATLVQGIGGWDPNKILESLKVVESGACHEFSRAATAEGQDFG